MSSTAHSLGQRFYCRGSAQRRHTCMHAPAAGWLAVWPAGWLAPRPGGFMHVSIDVDLPLLVEPLSHKSGQRLRTDEPKNKQHPARNDRRTVAPYGGLAFQATPFKSQKNASEHQVRAELLLHIHHREPFANLQSGTRTPSHVKSNTWSVQSHPPPPCSYPFLPCSLDSPSLLPCHFCRGCLPTLHVA